MIKHLDISGWSLDIDTLATATAYAESQESCACDYCLNFRTASRLLPNGLIVFLQELGVDVSRPIHISEICQNQDGSFLYSVFYDLIGKVVSAPEEQGDDIYQFFPIAPANVPTSVYSSISAQPSAPGHFVSAAIELQFILSVPWMLKS